MHGAWLGRTAVQRMRGGMVRRRGFACPLSFRLSHCWHFKNGRVSCCTVVCRELGAVGGAVPIQRKQAVPPAGRVVSTLCSGLCFDIAPGIKSKRPDFGECVATSANIPFTFGPKKYHGMPACY
jgi:hypothetical protein